MIKQPVIGIIASRQMNRLWPRYYTVAGYADEAAAVGCVPVLLPVSGSEGPEVLLAWVSACDGLMLTGGDDFSPEFYGEEPLPGFEREYSEEELHIEENIIELIRMFSRAGKPVLGICLGMQLINIAFGGTLIQDIPVQIPNHCRHNQTEEEFTETAHMVEIKENTLLYRLEKSLVLGVNSRHHQAVKNVAPGFIISARAEDGVIEGIENPGGTLLGVQWHPEKQAADRPEARRLFRWLRDRAEECRQS